MYGVMIGLPAPQWGWENPHFGDTSLTFEESSSGGRKWWLLKNFLPLYSLETIECHPGVLQASAQFGVLTISTRFEFSSILEIYKIFVI